MFPVFIIFDCLKMNGMESVDDYKDYTKEKKTIDILAANNLALKILGVGVVLLGVPFYLIWRPALAITWQGSVLFFLLFALGIVLHELIHGFVFGLYAKSGFKSIRFGFMKEYLTPYCHCSEPLKIRHYFIGALLPALLLGAVPIVASFFTGSLFWLIYGIVFFSAAAGDFLVVWVLRKEHPDTLVQDHDSEAGCWVYRKE